MTNRGRPKMKPEQRREKKLLVPVREDFNDRLESFKELTGISKAEILRRGAVIFINDSHEKKQKSYND